MRLHLTGLESFKALNGKVTLHLSVSSTGANETRVRMSAHDREETTVTRTSPFWTDVNIVGGDRKIPLKDGHFEFDLPATLFENDPNTLTLSWVDFYR